MSSLRPLAVIAVAASVTLSLAACAGGSAPAAAPSEAAESPLTPYYDALYGTEVSPEEQLEQDIERHDTVEATVAECMAEQGFEYTPVPFPADVIASVGGEEDVWRPDDRDWVEQWGYGMIDSPDRQEDSQPGGLPDDPNRAYYDSLTETEKAAYDEAISGPPLDEEEALLAEQGGDYQWEDGGCFGAAYEAGEDTPSDTADLTEFADLIARMDEVWKGVDADPEMIALEAAWSSCMDAAGESGFTAQGDAVESIGIQLESLFPAPETEKEAMAEPDLSPKTNPDAAALQEREIDLALVDLACREETDYHEKQQQITSNREQAFLDQNRAELDAMKLAAEQAR
jgi:hypothetical protein